MSPRLEINNRKERKEFREGIKKKKGWCVFFPPHNCHFPRRWKNGGGDFSSLYLPRPSPGNEQKKKKDFKERGETVKKK